MGNPEKLTRAHNTQETKTFHVIENTKNSFMLITIQKQSIHDFCIGYVIRGSHAYTFRFATN